MNNIETDAGKEGPPQLAEDDRIIRDITDQYRHQIQNLGEFITDLDPDYVLALSRSGPRILERFKRAGLIDNLPQIITEKAIPFMNDAEVKASNFLVFDDILIAGTTMWSWLEDFIDDYNVSVDNITVATLAIDTESAGLFTPEEIEGLPQKPASIELGSNFDYDKIPYHTFIKLDSRKRFQFSRNLIHCLSYINKPYDIDFALLDSVTSEGLIGEIKDHSSTCDLTTTKQRQVGLERYSLIVSPEATDAFQKSVFNDSNYHSRITKLRIYYDANSGKATFVPIFVFSIDESTLTEQPLFDTGKFGYLNEMLQEVVDSHLDRDSLTEEAYCKARFRVAWYLVSYLFGIFVNQHVIESEGGFLHDATPEQHLRYPDLAYLFGPDAATELIQTIKENYEALAVAMDEIEEPVETGSVNFDIEHPDDFEGDVQTMYKDLLPDEEEPDNNEPMGLEKLSDANSLQGNLAIIFEALYSQREFVAQQRIGDIGGDVKYISDEFPELVKRLRVGFTVPQIAGILSKHTSTDFRDRENNRKLSLAIDALVDKGEQIPIFIRTETDGGATWQRAYRHGESAFILYSEFRELMYHVFAEILSDRSLWNVAIEKIAVLTWKSLSDTGLLDDLDKPGAEDTIWIRNTLLPFGHTLDIVQGINNLNRNPEYNDIILDSRGDEFVQWALSPEVDLLEEANNRRESTLSASSAKEISGLPSPDPIAKTPSNLKATSLTHTQRARALARILYWIHTEIDPTSRGKYLIGLTSCTDHRTYLHALREEFRAMFRSPNYKMEIILKAMDQYRTDSGSWTSQLPLPSFDDDSGTDFPRLHENKKLQWPSEQAALKMETWEEMEEITREIKQFFEERKGDDLESTTGASSLPDVYTATPFPMFLDQVLSRHTESIAASQTEEFVHATELYGKLCVSYSRMLWAMYEIYWTCFGDGDDLEKAIKSFNDHTHKFSLLLNQNPIDEWPDEFHRTVRRVYTISAPRVDLETVNKADTEEQHQYLKSRLDKLETIHDRLKSIYSESYSKEAFKERLTGVSPSVWKDDGQFVVYWTIKNAQNQQDLERRLDDLQPEVNTRFVYVAENAQQLSELFGQIVRTVEKNDPHAEIAFGVAAADDVGERIVIDESLGQVESGNYLHLAKKLAEEAETPVEMDQGIKSDPKNSERVHSICISHGVRNIWGESLPTMDQDAIRIVQPVSESAFEWDEKLFELKNQREFVSFGRCFFIPTETFMTEETTLEEFNE